jgi:transcriptional regulator with XRE-family HTH domain
VKSKANKPSAGRGKSYRDEVGIKMIGARIRDIRKAKEITQEQLEHSTGFDLRQIGRIERGEVSTSLSNIFKIAECLGVPVHELFMFSVPKEIKKNK